MEHTASLAAFLAANDPHAHEDARWGELRFHLTTYLCAHLPPLELITSVRAVMLHRGQVMVVRDPGGEHVVPGGRRQGEESLDQTLRRELLEETGWTIDEPHLLGVRHFHLHPGPTAATQARPDFFQPVFVARARSYHPEARELDGYELDAAFRPLTDARRLPLPPNERLFLHAALRWSESAQDAG